MAKSDAVRYAAAIMLTMILIRAAIVLAATIAMELVAWSSHKYIMHGFGWGWHRDHHERHDRFFEKNDLYAVVGTAMSISCFMIGSPLVAGASAWWPATWIGLGIMAYGVIYTLIHDGIVHQRWFRYVPRGGYPMRLVQAHKLHHATEGKEGGVSFGFVFARDPKVLKRELKAQREAGIAKVRDAI